MEFRRIILKINTFPTTSSTLRPLGWTSVWSFEMWGNNFCCYFWNLIVSKVEFGCFVSYKFLCMDYCIKLQIFNYTIFPVTQAVKKKTKQKNFGLV